MSGQTDEKTEVQAGFVIRCHSGNPSRSTEDRAFRPLGGKTAVHPQQGLWNRSGPLRQFVIAEVSVLFHEIEFSKEANRPRRPVRMAVNGLDRGSLDHCSDHLFGT